jgi:hypothetical protein
LCAGGAINPLPTNTPANRAPIAMTWIRSRALHQIRLIIQAWQLSADSLIGEYEAASQLEFTASPHIAPNALMAQPGQCLTGPSDLGFYMGEPDVTTGSGSKNDLVK